MAIGLITEKRPASPATKQKNALREQEIPSSSIAMTITNQADVLIKKSRPQGRRLPQALAYKLDAHAADIQEVLIGTVDGGESLVIDILHTEASKNYQYVLKTSDLSTDGFDALGIAAYIQGLYKESILKQHCVAHEGLVFCDRSGKLDICQHAACKRAQVVTGNYIPVPSLRARARVPFTGAKLTKQFLRLPVYSDGKGGVQLGHATEALFSVDLKELGFILEIDAKKSEVEIFVNGEHGYSQAANEQHN